MLFSMPMVQGLDNDSKKMTRRTRGLETVNREPDKWKFIRILVNRSPKGIEPYAFFQCSEGIDADFCFKCPYGNVGDLLWVREAFRYCQPFGPESLCYEYRNGLYSNVEVEDYYKINTYDKWRPSIHMPKDAARIWLKITDIRVERLQDITEQDAIAEGIEELTPWPEAPDKRRFKLYPSKNYPVGDHEATFEPVNSFFTLWISINGDDSVRANPWVWVVVFEKVDAPYLNTTGMTTNVLEAYMER